MQILYSKLINKKVISSRAKEIGWVDDLALSPSSGEVAFLLVRPSEDAVDFDVEFIFDNRKRIVLPLKDIREVNDMVLMGEP